MKLRESVFFRQIFCAVGVHRLRLLCLLGLVLLLAGGKRAEAVPVYSSITGHYYEAVTGALTWTQARDAAAARTYLGIHGHLTTITTDGEQTFVAANFATASSGLTGVYWLGGYQDKNALDFSEPAGGFRWVTGETWQYTAWSPGEPNNGGGNGAASEDFLVFRTINGRWNDFGTATTGAEGYLVEYDVPKPAFDVNGDSYADILFQNTDTNQVAYWFMHGTTFLSAATTSIIPAAGYALRGTGDFNGDGTPDLVFQNTITGQIAIWFMSGTNVIGAQSVMNYPAAGYNLVGVGDFNGDGKPDLVFQNATSGQIAIWYMSGTNLIGYESTRAVPSAGYNVVGIGDFNSDGHPDLVFQNSSTGAIVFWYMNGAQYQSGAVASATPYANFKVVGVADYNNDGQPDLLFQNTATGQIAMWYMNGSVLVGGGGASAMPPSNYTAVGPR